MPAVLRMQRKLADLDPLPPLPPGIAIRAALLPAEAPAIHALLVLAFQDSREVVPPFTAWLPFWTQDDEYDPELWLVATTGAALVGAALCWSSAFLKDLAVDPSQRGRGVGRALLRQVFLTFARRGAPVLSLKVEEDNPSGARHLYESVGMRVIERIPKSG